MPRLSRADAALVVPVLEEAVARPTAATSPDGADTICDVLNRLKTRLDQVRATDTAPTRAGVRLRPHDTSMPTCRPPKGLA